MTEFKDEKLIRDALGSPVPQYLNLDLQMFAVQTLDGSTVTNGDIDFAKTKLLRDKLGSPIPQLWDAVDNKWTVATLDGSVVEGVNFSETKLLRDVLGSPIPQLWDEVNNKWAAQSEISEGGGSGGSNTRLITQSEYDVLTDLEKNDGTFYFIKEG